MYLILNIFPWKLSGLLRLPWGFPVWKASLGKRLMTDDLIKRRIIIVDKCSCKFSSETISYLLFCCPFARTREPYYQFVSSFFWGSMGWISSLLEEVNAHHKSFWYGGLTFWHERNNQSFNKTRFWIRYIFKIFVRMVCFGQSTIVIC